MDVSREPGSESAAAIARRRRIAGGVLELEIEDLLEIVPHRPPLLLLDKVLSLVPGEHAVALKYVCGDEAGLDHHRHGFVFPSTFAGEALTQLAQLVVSGVAVPEDRSARDRADADSWPTLASIESLTVHQEMLAPGPIHLTVSRLGEVEETLEEVAPGEAGEGAGRANRTPRVAATLVTCAVQASTETGLYLDGRFVVRRRRAAR